MSIDAMKQALAALENSQSYVEFDWVKNQCGRAITALRAAIEQTNDWDEVEALRASLREHMAEIHRLRAAIEQAQEPVAWVGPSWLNPETRTWESESFSPKPIKGWIPLYTAPRQWQGLTDDEIVLICGECAASHADDIRYARAIESKLKEKNT